MSTIHDPCAQPSLMHPDQAILQLLDQVPVIAEVERLALSDSFGRVLANNVASSIDLPPFDNSAMDGYAFNFDDVPVFDGLSLAGESFAGKPYLGACLAGTCIRIMTGAQVPSGFDTVQMQEKVITKENKVFIEAPKLKGACIRKQGEELLADTQVLAAGTLIRAAEMGVLATIGIDKVEVKRKVKVAFFSTGDELQPVSTSLATGQIYDSNRYSIQGLLSRANLDWIDLGIVPDDPEAIRAAFHQAAKEADMVLTSGGVSVGDADYIKQILEEEGEITFWRLAIKPGKPFAFGHLHNAVFCGLPGNPVSSMVTFYKLVWPLIVKMQGQPQRQLVTLQATLKGEIRKAPGRVEYQRGILSYNEKGEAEVRMSGAQGSGMLTSMTLANCFVILPLQQGNLPLESVVTVEPFNSVLD
ncbi:molybdopterin molybdotransferase MoeA [Shewanella surugensis]|uniref:Molybdopterin molybdenumtransferase n=1 Tax=Shewanella surugensis TaxID=212020 RepID=A0ABT0L8M9_9GAMM|nr:gephyrin-like molybdotransferase Glp [Shewanella surugensis]MCL1124054.1 molybdopterin-binding protein [Shewanella surugensis]